MKISLSPWKKTRILFRYDHLAHCIARLLNDQPRKLSKRCKLSRKFVYFSIEDGADIIEDVSRGVKSEATRAQQDTLRDRPAPDSEHLLAEEQKPLFEVIHSLQSSSSSHSSSLENR